MWLIMCFDRAYTISSILGSPGDLFSVVGLSHILVTAFIDVHIYVNSIHLDPRCLIGGWRYHP